MVGIFCDTYPYPCITTVATVAPMVNLLHALAVITHGNAAAA